MSETAKQTEATIIYKQRFWGIKTSFSLQHDCIEYRFERRGEESIASRVLWTAVPPPAAYRKIVETDRRLLWVAFVTSGLGLYQIIKNSSDSDIFFFVLSFSLILCVLTTLSRRLRVAGYTIIPSSDGKLVVLRGRHHDEIISQIERFRQAALRKFGEPETGETNRQFLRRLRWLVEADVISTDEFHRRQALLLPYETRSFLRQKPPSADAIRFCQRALGYRIDVELRDDLMSHRRKSLIYGECSYQIDYLDLQNTPSQNEFTQHSELAAYLICWLILGGVAWMNFVRGMHSPNYFIGNAGLQHLIVDFGPAVTAGFVSMWLLDRFTKAKFIRPYPDILLLRGRSFDQILTSIESRVVGSKRRLAGLDPLLTLEERRYLLDTLQKERIISSEELAVGRKQAEETRGSESLDEAVFSEGERKVSYSLH